MGRSGRAKPCTRRKEGQEATRQYRGNGERLSGPYLSLILRFDLAIPRIGRRCRVHKTRGGGLAELGSILNRYARFSVQPSAPREPGVVDGFIYLLVLLFI
jgi:hypothetical protein